MYNKVYTIFEWPITIIPCQYLCCPGQHRSHLAQRMVLVGNWKTERKSIDLTHCPFSWLKILFTVKLKNSIEGLSIIIIINYY